MKLKHNQLIYLSGSIWFIVGSFLLYTGLNLLITAVKQPMAGASFPLLDAFGPMLGGKDSVAIVIIALGLFIGYGKGRFVLGKSANRVANRLKSMPSPLNIVYLYSPGYWILIGSMMGLGMGIKYLGIPSDVRGLIDVAIGSALINGGMIFFRIGKMTSTPINKSTID